MKPENKNQLPVGTRVCVYWSRAYNCLFPGTIEDLDDVVVNPDEMVQVLLDDGDRRQVELESVRMLPHDYSHVGKCLTSVCHTYLWVLFFLDYSLQKEMFSYFS